MAAEVESNCKIVAAEEEEGNWHLRKVGRDKGNEEEVLGIGIEQGEREGKTREMKTFLIVAVG